MKTIISHNSSPVVTTITFAEENKDNTVYLVVERDRLRVI